LTDDDEFLMPNSSSDWYWLLLEGENHFHQFPNLRSRKSFIHHLLVSLPSELVN